MRSFLFVMLMLAGSLANSCEPRPKAVKWMIVYKCTLVAVVEFEKAENSLIVKVPLSMCANGINTAGYYGRSD